MFFTLFALYFIIMKKQVTPYSDSDKGKKEQVAGMFDTIAPKYDFLNHFLSLNIDTIWRKKVIKIVSAHNPKRILDVATGTGDLAIAALASNPDRIDGIDISEGMLTVGKRKIEDKKLEQRIFLQLGDAEAIPYADNTFDAITVAFGVRNFENLQQGLQEMLRVLKPNGICVVLEFTMPRKFPFKQFYGFYFKYLLPFIGKIVSKDKSAYTYLPESVKAFPQNQFFVAEMANAGFTQNSFKSLTMGIAAIYTGKKC
jgi:demethylmenaquinone methyltransferase/2-methoxy-6-polyprenyl-1,4-benzoquinol methylase